MQKLEQIFVKKNNLPEEMQNAIKYHTTGDENMNILSKNNICSR